MNDFDHARAVIDPIVDLALETDYKRSLSQIYTIIGTHDYMVVEDFPSAFEHLNQALKISEETSNIVSYSLCNYWLGMASFMNCDFENSYHFYEKALTVNTAAGRLWAMSSVKSSIALSEYFHGRLDAAYQTSQEALDTAEKSGEIYSRAMAYASHGLTCLGKGLFGAAKTHVVQAIELCERINYISWNAQSHYILGETYSQLGDYGKSKDYYEKAAKLLEGKNLMPSWSTFCRLKMRKQDTKLNQKGFELQRLSAYFEENGVKLFDGWTAREIGEILMNMDDSGLFDAESWVKKAIEADTKNGMRFNLGRDYALYAELFKRMGDSYKTKENLKKAIQILEECGADGWVEKYNKVLAAI